MSEQIYGIHAVTALLTFKPDSVSGITVQSGRNDESITLCLDLAKQANIPTQQRSRKDIDALFKSRVVHQGIVATCSHMPVYTEADIEGIIDATEKPCLLLIIDGIQDPHNLGACLRVANALGVCAVIAPKRNSVGLTSTAIKVSTGAAFATPFVQVTNLARTMRQLQKLGIWLVGGSAEADSDLKDIDMKGDMGIVMGAEGFGLRDLTAKTCDFLAKIPMIGTVDSLNVSVATGITLYEAYRQREDLHTLDEQ
jgi:23S rRNA (guanosine2251-2'-O)-methyltransferase